jgi:hypothetical protein
MKRARSEKQVDPPGSGTGALPSQPGQVKLQLNILVGEQVFPGEPFEISAPALAALRGQVGVGALPPGVTATSAAFSLQRCGEVWQVVFEGDHGFFGHTTGMTFIDFYLKHPGDSIHPVVLLARLQGQDPIQQRSVTLDDQDATDGYHREMDRLRAIIKNEKTSPGNRKVAEEELSQLEQADACIYHRTFDNAARTAKSVRQAINRSTSLLHQARDQLGRPHSVLQRFAAHLRKYLLGPPPVGSAPTGHLVYQPPGGVKWV